MKVAPGVSKVAASSTQVSSSRLVRCLCRGFERRVTLDHRTVHGKIGSNARGSYIAASRLNPKP